MLSDDLRQLSAELLKLSKQKKRCWDGYEPVPGKEPYSEGSCRKKQAKGKYDHIDFSIPKGVQNAAKRGLELRKEFGRGGTGVGVGTARLLAGGGNVSPEKARHIAKYFPRHAGDNLSDTASDGDPPSNGYIAWLLWGGDPGQAWSAKLVRQMEAADKRD